MNKTNIEWTDATWNPIRGCSRVSEGCRNCYAEKVAYRFSGPGQPYEGLMRVGADGERRAEWNGQVRFVEKHLLDPLKDPDMRDPVVVGCLTGQVIPHAKEGHCPHCTERPRRIFVNSMSDLFHESLDPQVIARCFAVMALANEHTFQVLTKRPKQALNLLACVAFRELVANFVDEIAQRVWGAMGTWSDEIRLGYRWPLPNVWLGVSVENQAAADERIPLLLQTPAAVRFISAEPLLGSVELRVRETDPDQPDLGWDSSALMDTDYWVSDDGVSSDGPRHAAIDWVICGGESGPGARPMHPDWARSLRDQCQAAGVPFFFKQWGEWGPNWLNDENGKVPNSEWMDRMGKKAAGAVLDGREWREFPV